MFHNNHVTRLSSGVREPWQTSYLQVLLGFFVCLFLWNKDLLNIVGIMVHTFLNILLGPWIVVY